MLSSILRKIKEGGLVADPSEDVTIGGARLIANHRPPISWRPASPNPDLLAGYAKAIQAECLKSKMRLAAFDGVYSRAQSYPAHTLGLISRGQAKDHFFASVVGDRLTSEVRSSLHIHLLR